jgi:hypothetical protein
MARKDGRLFFFDDQAVIRTTRYPGADRERLRGNVQRGPEVLEKNRLGFILKHHFAEPATGTVAPTGETESCLAGDDSERHSEADCFAFHAFLLVRGIEQ